MYEDRNILHNNLHVLLYLLLIVTCSLLFIYLFITAETWLLINFKKLSNFMFLIISSLTLISVLYHFTCCVSVCSLDGAIVLFVNHINIHVFIYLYIYILLAETTVTSRLRSHTFISCSTFKSNTEEELKTSNWPEISRMTVYCYCFNWQTKLTSFKSQL